jgi:hypothetical protein
MAGNLADALTGLHLDASISSVNTNIDTLGSSTRLGNIKGIDRGSISLAATDGATNTATIGAVVTARTQVTYSCSNGYGVRNDSGFKSGNATSARGTLTNTTTITASLGGHVSTTGTFNAVLAFEAVEYNS